MGPYFIGVDIGTTGAKAVIVDVNGNVLATAYEEQDYIILRLAGLNRSPKILSHQPSTLLKKC
jgi:sugar (pentulose or hexulose) kinase